MSHVAHKWAPKCFLVAGGTINISCLTAFSRRLLFPLHHPSLPTLNLSNLKINQQGQDQNKYERDSKTVSAEFPFAKPPSPA
jgi:hypothetical protein